MIAYLSHPPVRDALAVAPRYCRDLRLHLRRPRAAEIGKEFPTLIPCPTGFRQGFVDQMKSDSVIVRRPEPIHFTASRPIYCEWLLPEAQIVEAFGEAEVARLDTEYKVFRTQSILRALKVDPALVALFDDVPLQTYCPGRREWVTVEMGDFLTDRGFSIPAGQMHNYRKLLDESDD